jgi:hypothetical protein
MQKYQHRKPVCIMIEQENKKQKMEAWFTPADYG